MAWSPTGFNLKGPPGSGGSAAAPVVTPLSFSAGGGQQFIYHALPYQPLVEVHNQLGERVLTDVGYFAGGFTVSVGRAFTGTVSYR